MEKFEKSHHDEFAKVKGETGEEPGIFWFGGEQLLKILLTVF